MSIRNKGFSLIEMIIVLAILTIVSTGAIIGIRSIGYANTVNAAKRVDSVMDKVRLETMTRDAKQYLYLYNRDGVLYMRTDTTEITDPVSLTEATGTRLAHRVTLAYKKPGDGDETVLGNGGYLCITFLRSSGAFSLDSDYEYLKFTGSGKEAVIRCYMETGRHYVE